MLIRKQNSNNVIYIFNGRNYMNKIIQKKKNHSFLLKANNSSQLINSITNGTKVQKNNKYGEPVQILISDMK
jgi:hypothetical protein